MINYFHTLPTDCGCIIFTWLQPYEAIPLSRTSRWWYEISKKKQAYQPLPLPSFDRDDFDLLAYERWKNEQRDPFIFTPKELVQCSTSRVMQFQHDIALIFNRCPQGRFHRLDNVTDSALPISLERFHAVRCLTIQFQHSCRCPSFHVEDSLLPPETIALIVRVIRAWSQELVSFQIDIPLYGSQVFAALAEQTISIPHLQHVILPAEQKDAFAVLAHGFHISTEPAHPFASTSNSSSSKPFVPSLKPGGVLELKETTRATACHYPWEIESRREWPFQLKPPFIRQLSQPPFHLIVEDASITSRHSWCRELALELTRIHIITQVNEDIFFREPIETVQNRWNNEIDVLAAAGAKIQRFQLSGLTYHDPKVSSHQLLDVSTMFRLSASFQSLICKFADPPGVEVEEWITSFKRRIHDHTIVHHQPHPFPSLQSLTFRFPLSFIRSTSISVGDFPLYFPALNQLKFHFPSRLDVSGDLSSCTWLRHLSLAFCTPTECEYLGQVILGLTHLETLDVNTHDSYDSGPELFYYIFDALVLAHPSLCQVTLHDGFNDAFLQQPDSEPEELKEFQAYLIYLHLLWQKLVPAHPIPSITNLHPLTRIELLPLYLPFCSVGHRSLRLLCQKYDDAQAWSLSSPMEWSDVSRLTTRVGQTVWTWFNRYLGVGKRKEVLRLEAEQLEVRQYLENETRLLNERIRSLFESVGRSNIQPRHSYFRMRLLGCPF